MSHLIRGGLALALIVATLITLRALVLQGQLTLSEFGLRPSMQESNVAEWATRPLVHANSLGCASGGCHEDTYDEWATSSHLSVACETCHGPALAHVLDAEVPVPVDDDGVLCDLCHARLIARPSVHPQIDPADHYSESTCMACHKAHRPGPPPAINHEVTEGSDCLACHSADGPVDRAVPPTHTGRTNGVCMNCHEEAK